MKLIEAAKLLEVSQPTLSSWEGGRKSPSLDNLKRMADLYEVTTDYLLGRDPNFAIKASAPIPKQALGTLKTECIYLEKLETIEQAKEVIEDYIDFYNNCRIQLNPGTLCTNMKIYLSKTLKQPE